MTPSAEHQYQAYGLRIVSAIPFPELSGTHSTTQTDSTADFTVRRGSLPSDYETLDGGQRIYDDARAGYTVFRTATGFYWFSETFGTMCVRDGAQITVDIDTAVDPSAFRRFVLGPGICSALVQRGYLVLHASAVDIGGSVVAFAGVSGCGKSTAAGACYASGHGIVADDLTAVAMSDDGCHVVAGHPRLRLDSDTAEELGLRHDDSGSSAGKVSVDVSDTFRDGRHKLDTVYFLERGDRFSSAELPGPTAVYDLLQASYNFYADTDTEAQQSHLDDCGSVVRSCSVRRLTRPQSLSRIDDLVGLVEAETQ